MKKLTMQLENCYGIRSLAEEFSFEDCTALALYAPNGAMKSSLAKTFDDIAGNRPSKDRIFPERTTVRHIVDDNGSDIEPEAVLVVRPYDEDIGSSEKTSTLLVNPVLRKEYERINAGVEKTKKRFLDAMKKQSGSKKNIEQEISSTFSASNSQFIQAILRIADEVITQSEFPLADIPYDIVFDEKVLDALGKLDVKVVLEDYIRRYNELIDKSVYFKRGTFTYYNAAVIAKILADNGFFLAKHSIHLNGKNDVEVKTKEELEQVIKSEKESISSDPELRKKFSAVEKLLEKNVNVRQFHAYIAENENMLPLLANMAEFKEQVWKSYFGANISLFQELVEEIRSANKRRMEIESSAQKERTDWEDVIDIFNERFFVPFELTVKNRVSVMLAQENIPKLGFTFKEGSDRKDVERGELLEVLSTGEKKAFYILNLIFEIRARVKSKQKTLLVVDDVADSFDYKNKYAIVQYLKDISDDDNFRQIILTHNFDFFRTIQSRFVSYNSCYLVSRKEEGIKVEPATGIKNIFVNDWKPNFGESAKKRVASIPFMRNLVEFTIGTESDQFKRLTSLLHFKTETSNLSEVDIFAMYRDLFKSDLHPIDDGSTSVLSVIYREADACLDAPDGANFENKIVLSIATRLKAEEYMCSRIGDCALVDSITGNQTWRLLKEFKERFPEDEQAITAVNKVILMTPENIHLNSFMYEPILDMSDEHLRKIYQEVCSLSKPVESAKD